MSSGSTGGGLYADQSDTSLVDVTFDRNASDSTGGGAYVRGGSWSDLRGTWTDNTGDPTKSASASVKFGTVPVNDNTSVSFSF